MSAQNKSIGHLHRILAAAAFGQSDRYSVPVKLMGIVMAAAALLAACASVPPTPAARAITPEMLLEGQPLLGRDPVESLPEIDVLGLDSNMRVFLDRYVDPDQPDYFKVHQLLEAILDEETFGLDYDNHTRTAAETFHTQSGNCLSFTNMFVAMARQLGIDARFQEVDIPPDWTTQGGGYILNRHVNILIDLGVARDHVVDFDINFRANFGRQPVHDRRALAHYYNNIGVERMQAGDNVESLLYFREAIDSDGDFSPAWGNLGTLYRRNGNLAYAESAYRQALNANSRDLVAMSNLANLYRQQDDENRAAGYRRRVDAHRMRNPYYRFELGRKAFLAADYEGAIRHLRYAASKKRNEDSFQFLLGLSYLEIGDTGAAKRWLAQAREVSATDELKRKYDNKIQRLLSTSTTD